MTAAVPEEARDLFATPSEEDEARARTYSVLGALLAAPPSADMLAYLARIADAPGRGDAADPRDDTQDSAMGRAWSDLARAARASSAESAGREYHELFVGVGRGELMPYGSWYQTGYLMDEPLARLRSDLARLGYARHDGVHEPEDHVAALCEVMCMLVAGEEPVDFEAQKRFFDEHLAEWLGRFFQDLRSAEAAVFYRGVGHLGEQFTDIEKTYFSMLA